MSERRYMIVSDRWTREANLTATLEELLCQAAIFQRDRDGALNDDPERQRIVLTEGTFNGRRVIRDETGQVIAEAVDE